MKRIFVSICALVAAVSFANAQDVNQATDLYNDAVSLYSGGDLNSAISRFKKAYDIASQCGEDGVEITVDCQTYIPQLGTQVAKDLAQEGNFDGATAKLEEVAAICDAIGISDDAAKLRKMIPTFFMQQANSAVKAKDYTTALAAYDKVLAIDPANGNAALQKGQVLNALGKLPEAQAAYELALNNGQEKAAKRQLGKLFVKQAKAASSAKNYNTALEHARKAISYNPSEDNAYYLGGIAAQALKKNTEAIELFEKYLELKPAASNSQAVRQVVEALKKGNK